MSSGNPEQERAREKRAAKAWAVSPGLPWDFAAQFAAAEVALAVAAERKLWHPWVRHKRTCEVGTSIVYDSGTPHESRGVMECDCGLAGVLDKTTTGRR